ncbi:hypothetical protein ACFYOF_06235 [Streptomyces sp. NPDC007148]|uniref:hypothetical protein n=1 Tax=Streptomyces sp. NPDC007148 TaxID=3364775 RepID=UPI0036D018C7
MASTTRSTTRQGTTARARKRAAAKPVPLVDEEYELVELTSTVEDEDRVALFSIDGEVYTVPRRVPQGIALEFLRIGREHGEQVAAVRLLERLLGPEAYSALEQCPTLDDQQMQKILDMAQKIAFGKAEVKGGKAR